MQASKLIIFTVGMLLVSVGLTMHVLDKTRPPLFKIIKEIPLPVAAYKSFLIQDGDRCYIYMGALKQKDVKIEQVNCPD
jgi:hypothetical protein